MLARQGRPFVAVGQGQPHVEDLHRPPFVEHQVGRLDVAVDEPFVVGVLEPCRRLPEIVRRLADIEWPLRFDLGVEIHAVDIFEHDKMDRARRLEVEGPGDVGMVEPGGGLRLPLEARQIGALVDALYRQDLDRHLVVEGGVFGEVNAAHAAGAEEPQQLVFPEDEALVAPLAELIDLPRRQSP